MTSWTQKRKRKVRKNFFDLFLTKQLKEEKISYNKEQQRDDEDEDEAKTAFIIKIYPYLKLRVITMTIESVSRNRRRARDRLTWRWNLATTWTSTILKYYLTLHHRRDSVVFNVKSIRLFHEGNKLFVLRRLGEGKVYLNWSGSWCRINAVLNSIARCFERIDEDEIAGVPVRTHIVRTVKWLGSNGVSQTQLRNSRLERECFVASVQLNWCVWIELRSVFKHILRQVIIGSTDFIAFPSFSPAVERRWLGICLLYTSPSPRD